MTKKFTHDSDDCEFLGHFFDHDVYTCEGSFAQTIIARYGNDGHEYASTPVYMLKSSLEGGCRITVGKESPFYLDWLFSDQGCKSTKAMVTAFALQFLKETK